MAPGWRGRASGAAAWGVLAALALAPEHLRPHTYMCSTGSCLVVLKEPRPGPGSFLGQKCLEGLGSDSGRCAGCAQCRQGLEGRCALLGALSTASALPMVMADAKRQAVQQMHCRWSCGLCMLQGLREALPGSRASASCLIPGFWQVHAATVIRGALSGTHQMSRRRRSHDGAHPCQLPASSSLIAPVRWEFQALAVQCGKLTWEAGSGSLGKHVHRAPGNMHVHEQPLVCSLPGAPQHRHQLSVTALLSPGTALHAPVYMWCHDSTWPSGEASAKSVGSCTLFRMAALSLAAPSPVQALLLRACAWPRGLFRGLGVPLRDLAGDWGVQGEPPGDCHTCLHNTKCFSSRLRLLWPRGMRSGGCRAYYWK